MLLAIFCVVWLLLAINPLYRQDWLLENVIVLVAVAALLLTHRSRPLSTASYAVIFVYLLLHEIGAHYTYAEVPYDDWWKSISGFSLNATFGWERNHFDRLLHLLYGVLISYPVYECVVRAANARAAWTYAAPVLVIVSTSTTFELFEWGAATVFGGDLGMAYLGTQGDVWDAHKDMSLAAVGAVATMAVVSITSRNTSVTQNWVAD